MQELTVSKARKILKDKGVFWTCYQDLRTLELKTNDKDIKSACVKLANFIVYGDFN